MAFLHGQAHSFQRNFLMVQKRHLLPCCVTLERSSWVKLFPLNLPGSNLGQPAIRIILTTPLVGQAVVRLRRWPPVFVPWRWAHKPSAPPSARPPFVVLSDLNRPTDVFPRPVYFPAPHHSILSEFSPRMQQVWPWLRRSCANTGITPRWIESPCLECRMALTSSRHRPRPSPHSRHNFYGWRRPAIAYAMCLPSMISKLLIAATGSLTLLRWH